MTRSKRSIRCAQALVLGVAAALTACATRPVPPSASLEAARQAIANAEEARAAEHAPLELRKARDRLNAANEAVSEEDMLLAERRAEEARALAELAFAIAEMEDARAVNTEIAQSTEILKEEMQRVKGGRQ